MEQRLAEFDAALAGLRDEINELRTLARGPIKLRALQVKIDACVTEMAALAKQPPGPDRDATLRRAVVRLR